MVSFNYIIHTLFILHTNQMAVLLHSLSLSLSLSSSSISHNQKRINVAPTSANPETASASVKGVWLPRSSNGDAAAVDCWAGGVPDEDEEGDVRAGVLVIAELLEPLDRRELGIGVSPGGMPIEPSDVTPPLQC
jgi:hypothetical protein